MADDGYEAWYADRLWSLLPAIYRTQDDVVRIHPADPNSETIGPLRELVNRIGVQVAAVRRGVDALAANQFIETCDDWAIPYIGDLLATRLVACMDARAQRLDVARTIYYRRRAGTVGLLEELASDIVGHDARVVEFFRRMGRTRHLFDPPVGSAPRAAGPTDRATPAVVEGLLGAFTRTQAGGYADLRNVYGATNAHTAFDEFFHTADFRRGRQTTGWHDIPRLGVFVWWLHAYPILNATPVPRAGCLGQYSFDPTGRDIPLFAPSERARADFGEHWVSPQEWKLPTPIREVLWEAAPQELYPRAFSVGLGGGIAPALADPTTLRIDPPTGRFSFPGGAPLGRITTTYSFGLSGPVGAGGFDERLLPGLDQPAVTATPSLGVGLDAALAAVTGDATIEIADSATYPGPAANLTIPAGATLVLRAANQSRPVLRWPAGADWTITGGAGCTLVIQGAHLQGGDIRLAGDFDTVRLRLATLDPGTSGLADTPAAVFRTAIDGRLLNPTRLLIAGAIKSLILERCIVGPIRTVDGGAVEQLTLSDSIIQAIPTRIPADALHLFDPAALAAEAKIGADPLAVSLRAALTVTVRNALAAYEPDTVPTAALRNGLLAGLATLPAAAVIQRFPLALADLAMGLSAGQVSLVRTTVIGPTRTHRLSASESVLTDLASVDDPQHGCVRFSVYADGSGVHAPYRCLRVPAASPILASDRFGDPNYARLWRGADAMILAAGLEDSLFTCAQNGSEAGAFSSERNALKRRGLAQKYLEYMPIGVTPVWLDAD